MAIPSDTRINVNQFVCNFFIFNNQQRLTARAVDRSPPPGTSFSRVLLQHTARIRQGYSRILVQI